MKSLSVITAISLLAFTEINSFGQQMNKCGHFPFVETNTTPYKLIRTPKGSAGVDCKSLYLFFPSTL